MHRWQAEQDAQEQLAALLELQHRREEDWKAEADTLAASIKDLQKRLAAAHAEAQKAIRDCILGVQCPRLA